ncbi:MAG: hypothetical protein ABSF10_04260 [Verrucomicrobiota bacterium]
MNGRPVIVYVERGRPLYLAWRIVDEARDYFRTSWVPSPGSATLSHQMGEGLADKLAHRAEVVFAHQPSWARKASNFAEASMDRSPRDKQPQFQSQCGREAILASMRHWLAGSLSSVAAHCEGRMLAKENPALFRDLPESFKVGHPLPAHSTLQKRAPLPRAERENHRQRFVHGCELLPR